MKKLVLLFTVFVALAAFKVIVKPFTGKILYRYSFKDLQGNDINEKLVPYLGSEQHYFIDNKNYKSLYQGKLQQLYNSETNAYYFIPDGRSAQKLDGSQPTSQIFKVTPLNKTEKVAGYSCKAIQVETDNATTVYFYSPEIRTDKKVFSKHGFGEWNKYLEATDGALALKFVMTDKKNGFVWTSTATEVSKMDFGTGDFVLPRDVVVKE
ncbi:hypothetical protein [Pontibacter pamirensis]|uniref:hypothetical protein n=1 Tax=Pontibacter pamirensis TaxID=2562824 RepID=UPI001389E04D|nr:hypothetical protein [Pontibacter pamirensis]